VIVSLKISEVDFSVPNGDRRQKFIREGQVAFRPFFAPCGPVDPFILRTFIGEWLSSSPDTSDSLLYLPLIPLPTSPVNNRPCRPIPDTPVLNTPWLRNDKLPESRVLALVMSVSAGGMNTLRLTCDRSADVCGHSIQESTY
jgi:hypothetical protein